MSHVLEVLDVQRVALDVAHSQAVPAPEALDVLGDLLGVVHVQQDDLGAPRQLVHAPGQVGEQLQHEGRVLPAADEHCLHG